MREQFAFEIDLFTKRRMAMLNKIIEEDPGAISWWNKQPVNCFQMVLDDLDEVLATGDDRAIDKAFRFTENELALWVRFYRYAKAYTLEKKENGENVHWRIEA